MIVEINILFSQDYSEARNIEKFLHKNYQKNLFSVNGRKYFHIFASTFHTAYSSWRNKFQIAKISYFPIWWKYIALDHFLGSVWI